MRRTDIIGDGFSALHSIGTAIKGRLMVTFVSQHGALEAGIDHGGLVKEFLEEVGATVLDHSNSKDQRVAGTTFKLSSVTSWSPLTARET